MIDVAEDVSGLDRLASWLPIHGADRRFDDDGRLVLSEGTGEDFHLLRKDVPSARLGMVTLEVEATPAPEGTSSFYVNAFGGRDLAVVARNGAVERQGHDVTVEVAGTVSGGHRIRVTYLSRHPTVAMGTYRDAGMHAGSGRDEWIIERAEVAVSPLPSMLAGDRLTFVDVGAHGGLQYKWWRHLEDLNVVFFEPSPESATHLRMAWPEATLIEAGLLDREIRHPLHITRNTGCTSLLEPDTELLSRWKVAPIFDVMRTVEVKCERYDALHARGVAPVPDAMKIDVQGVEYEVLVGLGDLIHSLIGVELEAQFYPIYKDQKLLHEMVEYLAGYGLVLRRLEPEMNFDTDLVEVNAYFTRPWSESMPQAVQRKLRLLEQVWELIDSGSGEMMAKIAGVTRKPNPTARLTAA